MCYLIAKRFDEPGCFAVQAEGGKPLAQLVSYLGLKLSYKEAEDHLSMLAGG